MTDANEIIHALRLWFQAGDVFEVRVLDAVSADYRREHVKFSKWNYLHNRSDRFRKIHNSLYDA